MNVDQLPKPSLDPRRREEILRDVLADGAASSARHPRGWLIPVGAAAAVGVLAAGAVVVGEISRPAPEPSPPASAGGDDQTSQQQSDQAPKRVRSVDLGPVTWTTAQTRKGTRCLTSFGLDPARFHAAYARMVDGPWGPAPAIVYESSADGTALFCGDDGDGLFAGPDSKSIVRLPDAAHPIRATDGGAGGLRQSVDTRTGQAAVGTDGLYRVTDTVDRVEMRIGSLADPGVWRSARAHDGYVYVTAWNTLPAEAKLFTWVRAFDVHGQPITGGPTGRTPMPALPSLGPEAGGSNGHTPKPPMPPLGPGAGTP